MDLTLTITFWLGGSLLIYTFLGYPLCIHFLGKSRVGNGENAADCDHNVPATSVSVVLVVRNEAQRIESRIRNLLETDHPVEATEVIIVSDGSTDDTTARAMNLTSPSIRLIEGGTHRGKPACINDGVAAATGEIIVFADARQQFTPSTIPALITAFADPGVGAASGELLIGESGTGVASGVDAYWRLEKAIRLGESRLDSAIGCTGAVYAIRKSCFQPLPDDTILDDVVCPMRIALRGMRVLFCPAAIAFDPQRLEPGIERRRKRRTLAGNFQMLFRYPSWLLPWKNRLFIQLLSHKYLRLAAPILLATTLCSSTILALHGSPFFLFAATSQCGFYLAAALGMVLPRATSRWLSLPAGFTFLNLMTLLGFFDYFNRRRKGGW